MRNLFSDSIPAAGEQVALSGDEAAHAVRVLRLRTGDRLVLLDGQGHRADAAMTSGSRDRRTRVQCEVLHVETAPPPKPRVRLCVAPPRAPRQMAQIVRQATELGFWSIVPVIFERSVSRPAGSVPDHWRAEARAAVKQSGNCYAPLLGCPARFDEVIARSPGAGIFGAVPSGHDVPPRVCVPGEDVDLWVGPEGGFSSAETKQLLQAGLVPVSVGRCILRVETAVTALGGWLSAQGVLQ